MRDPGECRSVGRAAVTGFAAGMLVCATAVALALAGPDLGRARELALQRYGADAAATVTRWIELIEQSGPLSEREKLVVVNGFFNRHVGFEDDTVVWGVRDHWATPLETLGRGQGDCEDYSIGKYVTLGLMGVPVERMRITYVRAEVGLAGSGISQAHMVLAYYTAPDADPLILDNLVSELRPASRRPDLHPVFGFNSEGLWLGGTIAPAARDPTARLSRWRDVLRRMTLEGLN